MEDCKFKMEKETQKKVDELRKYVNGCIVHDDRCAGCLYYMLEEINRIFKEEIKKDGK